MDQIKGAGRWAARNRVAAAVLAAPVATGAVLLLLRAAQRTGVTQGGGTPRRGAALPADVGRWTQDDVGEWVAFTGLSPQAARGFVAQGVDGFVLLRLAESDFASLGVTTVGDRVRLSEALAQLRAVTASPGRASRGSAPDRKENDSFENDDDDGDIVLEAVTARSPARAPSSRHSSPGQRHLTPVEPAAPAAGGMAALKERRRALEAERNRMGDGPKADALWQVLKQFAGVLTAPEMLALPPAQRPELTRGIVSQLTKIQSSVLPAMGTPPAAALAVRRLLAHAEALEAGTALRADSAEVASIVEAGSAAGAKPAEAVDPSPVAEGDGSVPASAQHLVSRLQAVLGRVKSATLLSLPPAGRQEAVAGLTAEVRELLAEGRRLPPDEGRVIETVATNIIALMARIADSNGTEAETTLRRARDAEGDVADDPPRSLQTLVADLRTIMTRLNGGSASEGTADAASSVMALPVGRRQATLRAMLADVRRIAAEGRRLPEHEAEVLLQVSGQVADVISRVVNAGPGGDSAPNASPPAPAGPSAPQGNTMPPEVAAAAARQLAGALTTMVDTLRSDDFSNAAPSARVDLCEHLLVQVGKVRDRVGQLPDEIATVVRELVGNVTSLIEASLEASRAGSGAGARATTTEQQQEQDTEDNRRAAIGAARTLAGQLTTMLETAQSPAFVNASPTQRRALAQKMKSHVTAVQARAAHLPAEVRAIVLDLAGQVTEFLDSVDSLPRGAGNDGVPTADASSGPVISDEAADSVTLTQMEEVQVAKRLSSDLTTMLGICREADFASLSPEKRRGLCQEMLERVAAVQAEAEQLTTPQVRDVVLPLADRLADFLLTAAGAQRGAAEAGGAKAKAARSPAKPRAASGVEELPSGDDSDEVATVERISATLKAVKELFDRVTGGDFGNSRPDILQAMTDLEDITGGVSELPPREQAAVVPLLKSLSDVLVGMGGALATAMDEAEDVEGGAAKTPNGAAAPNGGPDGARAQLFRRVETEAARLESLRMAPPTPLLEVCVELLDAVGSLGSSMTAAELKAYERLHSAVEAGMQRGLRAVNAATGAGPGADVAEAEMSEAAAAEADDGDEVCAALRAMTRLIGAASTPAELVELLPQLSAVADSPQLWSDSPTRAALLRAALEAMKAAQERVVPGSGNDDDNDEAGGEEEEEEAGADGDAGDSIPEGRMVELLTVMRQRVEDLPADAGAEELRPYVRMLSRLRAERPRGAAVAAADSVEAALRERLTRLSMEAATGRAAVGGADEADEEDAEEEEEEEEEEESAARAAAAGQREQAVKASLELLDHPMFTSLPRQKRQGVVARAAAAVQGLTAREALAMEPMLVALKEAMTRAAAAAEAEELAELDEEGGESSTAAAGRSAGDAPGGKVGAEHKATPARRSSLALLHQDLSASKTIGDPDADALDADEAVALESDGAFRPLKTAAMAELSLLPRILERLGAADPQGRGATTAFERHSMWQLLQRLSRSEAMESGDIAVFVKSAANLLAEQDAEADARRGSTASVSAMVHGGSPADVAAAAGSSGEDSSAGDVGLQLVKLETETPSGHPVVNFCFVSPEEEGFTVDPAVAKSFAETARPIGQALSGGDAVHWSSARRPLVQRAVIVLVTDGADGETNETALAEAAALAEALRNGFGFVVRLVVDDGNAVTSVETLSAAIAKAVDEVTPDGRPVDRLFVYCMSPAPHSGGAPHSPTAAETTGALLLANGGNVPHDELLRVAAAAVAAPTQAALVSADETTQRCHVLLGHDDGMRLSVASTVVHRAGAESVTLSPTKGARLSQRPLHLIAGVTEAAFTVAATRRWLFDGLVTPTVVESLFHAARRRVPLAPEDLVAAFVAQVGESRIPRGLRVSDGSEPTGRAFFVPAGEADEEDLEGNDEGSEEAVPFDERAPTAVAEEEAEAAAPPSQTDGGADGDAESEETEELPVEPVSPGADSPADAQPEEEKEKKEKAPEGDTTDGDDVVRE